MNKMAAIYGLITNNSQRKKERLLALPASLKPYESGIVCSGEKVVGKPVI